MRNRIAAGLVGLVVLMSVDPTRCLGAEPADKCEATKLKLAGVYAACRLKADAKARKKGTTPDDAKCEESFLSKFAKTEDKAGPGTCPTEGDQAAIEAEIAAATDEVAEQLRPADPACPPGYRDRTPSEVVLDTYAAAEAQNPTLIACNYHPSAFVVDDQGVLVGHADILASFASLSALFDGVAFQIVQVDEFEDVVRVLWRLDAGWVVIEDGVDTYQVRRGWIRFQSRHGLITYTGPPPA